MKKFLFLFVAIFALVCAGAEKPKYLFLFIGDGMSIPQRMTGEEFARTQGMKLVMNSMPYTATTRTSSANSFVTDSAAAATAIACGTKTLNGRIGLDKEGNRLESMAEVAKKAGYKVGIITSVNLNHATPGGFYGHRKSRGEGYNIGLDLVASGFDFFAGGKLFSTNDTKNPNYKGDIYDLARKAGYKVVKGAEGLKSLTPADKKVLMRASSGRITPAIDGGDPGANLHDMVTKGIELLDNPNGFFMMVEGGAIDYAGHANEPAENLRELLALDKAVQVAVDFAGKHPEETLIVVTGDHETGGMLMGFAGGGHKFAIERLAHQKVSIGRFGHILKEKNKEKKLTFEETKPLLTEYFGFQFTGDSPMKLTEKEIKILEDAFAKNKLPRAARQVLSGKAGVSWSTGGHTAQPVLTTAMGCGAENFTGFIENTDISKKFKALMTAAPKAEKAAKPVEEKGFFQRLFGF